jgi:glutathione S-transferase
MWSFWAQSEMEGPLETIASLEAVPEAWRSRALGVLDGALAARGQLVGERFTVADLNVANMFNGPVSSRLDLSAFPRARDWLARCRGRPAAQRVLRRIAAELAGRKA